MTTPESISKLLVDPVRIVTGSNLLGIFILAPLLLFIVVGYYFAWHEISSSAIWFITIFLSFWLLLFVFGYLGSKGWKTWGRIATFVAWLPMLFAFPIGTFFGAWVIYSVFKKPVFS